jgi:hypothetical protein
MENKKPFGQLYDPHQKAQDAIDHAREAREEKLVGLGKKAAPEPHLISDGHQKRCSVCKQPFFGDGIHSVDSAFARHVLAHHRPGQTREDSSQAALRIVSEATENK